MFLRKNRMRISERYRNKSRGVRYVAPLSVIAVLSFLVFFYYPQAGLVFSASITTVWLAVHCMLTFPDYTKWVIVALFGLNISTGLSLIAGDADEQGYAATTVLTWQSVQVITAILVFITAIKVPAKGKLWLTQLLCFLAVFVGAGLALVAWGNPSSTVVIIPVLAGIPLLARIIFPLRPTVKDVTPDEDTESTLAAVKKAGYMTTHAGDTVVIANKKGQVCTVDSIVLNGPLSINKKGAVMYQGKPFASYIASSLHEASHSLPRGIPFTHVIMCSGGLVQREHMTLHLASKKSRTPVTVLLISKQRFAPLLRELVEELSPIPASKKDILRLRQK